MTSSSLPQPPLVSVDAQDVVRRVFVGWLVTIGVLVLLDVIFTTFDVTDVDDESSVWSYFNDTIWRLFNTAKEGSIPSFVGCVQAVFVGGIVFLIRALDRRTGAGRGVLLGWAVIACFFVWLGIDDAAEIHESLGSDLKAWFGRLEPDTAEGYGWQRFILPVYGAVGLFTAVFCWIRTRGVPVLRWFVAGSVLWVGAIALDRWEGYEAQQDSWARWMGWDPDVTKHVFKLIEETMEMVGMTFLGQGFLRYLAARSAGLMVSVRASTTPH